MFVYKLLYSEVLKTGREGLAISITAVIKNAALRTFPCFCKVLSASVNMVV